MKPKISMLVAAGILLAGVTLVVTQVRGKLPDTSKPFAEARARTYSSVSSAGGNPDEAPSMRSSAKQREIKDKELADQYGESRTKLARHVSESAVAVFGDLLDLGLQSKMLTGVEDRESIPEELSAIKDKLALTKEQLEKVAESFHKANLAGIARAKVGLGLMQKDPTPMMETLLAGDAFKRGKIDEAQFQRLKAAAKAKTSSSVETLLEMDPLNDMELIESLNRVFDPGQRESLQAFLGERSKQPEDDSSKKSESPFDLDDPTGLEEFETKITAMKSLTQGLKQTLEAAGTLKGSIQTEIKTKP